MNVRRTFLNDYKLIFDFRIENGPVVVDVTLAPYLPRRYRKKRFSWRAIGYSECNKSCGGGKWELSRWLVYGILFYSDLSASQQASKASVCYVRCSGAQTRVYQRAHAAAGAGEEMSRVREAAGGSSQVQYQAMSAQVIWLSLVISSNYTQHKCGLFYRDSAEILRTQIEFVICIMCKGKYVLFVATFLKRALKSLNI